MIHGERHVHAWRRRVNQSGRIADGAAARAMKIAFRPKLLDCLPGYTRAQFAKIIMVYLENLA